MAGSDLLSGSLVVVRGSSGKFSLEAKISASAYVSADLAQA